MKLNAAGFLSGVTSQFHTSTLNSRVLRNCHNCCLVDSKCLTVIIRWNQNNSRLILQTDDGWKKNTCTRLGEKGAVEVLTRGFLMQKAALKDKLLQNRFLCFTVNRKSNQ